MKRPSTSASDIAIHLLRTLLIVIAGAGLFWLAFVVNHPILWILLIGGGIFGIFYYGKLAALWAPVAKPVRVCEWRDEQGVPHESVVEHAHLQVSGHSSSANVFILRLSIYRLEPPDHRRRRLRRIVLGDDARFLGQFADSLWFYCESRYHSGRDGLIQLDRRNGDLLYRLPKAQGHFESCEGKTVTLSRPRSDETFTVDLSTGAIVT